MARAFSYVVALTLACAVVCAAVHASDEETPQTGTIEVEVVYKDTGEPVERVLVCVTASQDVPGGNLGITCGYTSATGSFVVRDRPAGSYEVRIDNNWVDAAGDVGASHFLYDESDAVKTVAVSRGSGARARFVVERGSALSGVVRRRDGSRLDGGVVSISQEDSGFGEAFSRIDRRGRFEMLGVVPKPRVRATIYSALKGPNGQLAGMPVVAEREIELAGASTVVDLQVQTASIEIVLEVERALWPLDGHRGIADAVVDGWIGDAPEPTELGPDIVLTFDDAVSAQRARRPFWARKDRYSFVLGDLPPETQIAFAIEDEDGQVTRPLKTVHTGGTASRVVFSIRVRGARASRALWFGVPAAIVLAVCVTILVRHVRRRRAGERSD